MSRTAALVVSLLIASASPAQSQGVIVDHTSLPLFDQIPEQYVTAASQLSMMFVNRSVGANISDGLTCLAYESTDAAPTSCRRYEHPVPEFSSPRSEVVWTRSHPRTNWQYYGWPGGGIPPELSCGVPVGMWYSKLDCFIRWIDANPTAYSVASINFSYLEVGEESDIADPATGFFASQPNRVDLGDFEAMKARHPQIAFVLHTSSLARGIGTRVSTEFNDRMRSYVREHGGYLLDIADIESHDPWGNPCFDNRDGVPYETSNTQENFPDDGLALPALCQHYTRESNGGHLGNPDVGKIRLAKAYWILMARIAGWNPGTTIRQPLPPSGVRALP